MYHCVFKFYFKNLATDDTVACLRQPSDALLITFGICCSNKWPMQEEEEDEVQFFTLDNMVRGKACR